MQRSGFTVMELLIIIAILGILAVKIIPELTGARDKANTAKVQTDLRNLHMAIAALENDVVKWPNGCQPDTVDTGANNEVMVTDACTGLYTAPQLSPACSCGWTTVDAALWSGPYATNKENDPWGSPYWYDADYYPRKDCATKDPDHPDTVAVVALVSLGPNKTGGPDAESYDCDDIYRIISN